jgi:hypothetical protein
MKFVENLSKFVEICMENIIIMALEENYCSNSLKCNVFIL